MLFLTIREEGINDSGFTASLNFDDGNSYPITITDSFTNQEEKQLEWYVVNFPFNPRQNSF
jgi:hypothetical protein